MKKQLILVTAFLVWIVNPAFAQNKNTIELKQHLRQIVKHYKANIGLAITDLENGDTLTLNTHQHCPMQSVFKFPLAIAILHQVDEKKLSLEQNIHVTKTDLKPNTWSPLREKYPEGQVDISLLELLKYTVSQSDNNTCDILFRLAGGTGEVNKYIHQLGITEIEIAATEEEMGRDWAVQYTNWTEPMAINILFKGLYKHQFLSDESTDFLMRLLKETSTGPKRLKGLLPEDMVVAHKTGTGGDNEKGMISGVNDAGIIFLPNGRHIALSVFVSNSYEGYETSEKAIAEISKAVVEYYMRESILAIKINALLAKDTQHLFNGVVLIAKKGYPIYSKKVGDADFEKKLPLKMDNQFVIGSVSKQFTAVMVLQEMEKGHLKLDVPIHAYLPELSQGWADTVTVHHLLTHTHGLIALNKPSTFIAGTKMDYEQGNDIGYYLLSMIVEKTSGNSFANLSAELFKKCKMKATYHPDIKMYKKLVKGYTRQNSLWVFDSTSLTNSSAAAGAFISTAGDLVLWNQCLHRGQLLKKETYTMMIAKQKNAVRQHRVFGVTEYGYGLTVRDQDSMLQLGQTGFAPGFVSMNFYFPETQTSVVLLENVVSNIADFKQSFYYHKQILEFVRSELTEK